MHEDDYDDDYCECEECLEEAEEEQSTEGGGTSYNFPWDMSHLDDKWLIDTSKKDSWKKVWNGVNNEKIDPAVAAADYYLLYGISTNSFVHFDTSVIPSNEEVMAAGTTLQLTKKVINTRIKEFSIERTNNPIYKLTEIAGEANDKFVTHVNFLDESFRQYIHLACGGELRHHQAIGVHGYYGGNRRTAWTRWFHIFEKEGPDALAVMAKYFRECGGGGYCGPPWANAADILRERELFTLGPDEFTTKQLFVDRVFSLEHNNGCILNKLNWANHRKGRSGASTDAIYDNYMQNTVLTAHAANPVDLNTLHAHASTGVQKLLGDYFALATNSGFAVQGKWDGAIQEKPKPIIVESFSSTINWEEEDDKIVADTLYKDSDKLYKVADTLYPPELGTFNNLDLMPAPNFPDPLDLSFQQGKSHVYHNLDPLPEGVSKWVGGVDMPSLSIGYINIDPVFYGGKIPEEVDAKCYGVTTWSGDGNTFVVQGLINGLGVKYKTKDIYKAGYAWFSAIAYAGYLILEQIDLLPEASKIVKKKKSDETSSGKPTDLWPIMNTVTQGSQAMTFGNNHTIKPDSSIDAYTGKTPKVGYKVSNLMLEEHNKGKFIKFTLDFNSGYALTCYSGYLPKDFTIEQGKLLANKMTFLYYKYVTGKI